MMSEFEILGKLGQLILEELKLIRKDMKVEVRKLGEELKTAYSLNKKESNAQRSIRSESEHLFQNVDVPVSLTHSQQSVSKVCENLSKTNYSITERLAAFKNKQNISINDREFESTNLTNIKTPNCKVKIENPMSLLSYEVGMDVMECFNGLERSDEDSSDHSFNLLGSGKALQRDDVAQSCSIVQEPSSIDESSHMEISNVISVKPDCTMNDCNASNSQNNNNNEHINSTRENICFRRQSMPVLSNTTDHQSDNFSFEENFKCQYCGKPFRHFSSYECHLRTHTGEKPFPCPVCHKPFAQKGNLKTHMLIHASERPHVCSICSRSFAQKGNLKSHLLVHKREPLFQCETCKKGFKSLTLLSAHASVHM